MQTARKGNGLYYMENNDFKFKNMYDGLDEKKLARKRMKNKLGNVVGLIITCLILLTVTGLATAYYYKSLRYKDHFYNLSYINGIDVSGMTEEQVEKILKDKVEDYSIEITYPDGQKGTMTREDIKLTYVSDGSVKRLLKEQNYLLWGKGPIGIKSEYTAPEAYTYDKDVLTKSLKKMPQFQKDKIKDSRNAFMKKDKKENKIIIVNEIEGNHIKKDEFVEALCAAIDKREATISFDDSIYMKPSIYRTNKKLKARVKDLNDFLKTKIVLTLQDGDKYKITRKKLINWLSKDKKKKNWFCINDKELKQRSLEEAAKLADCEDSYFYSYPFKSTRSGTIEVGCSEYGWTIDQHEEADLIYKAVKNRKSENRKPTYSEFDQAPVGDSYIEIDIPNQEVFMYIDGKQILDAYCVSGTDTIPDRRSDRGLFYVDWKVTDHVMKGAINPETGQPSYESHVNYATYYNGGEALHDASWRSEFGGSTYLYSGSHGCINMAYNDAKTVYENAYVGMPVIVFSY